MQQALKQYKASSNEGDANMDKQLAQPAQDFDTAVSAILKRDHCSHTKALERARKEHPEMFDDYQADVPEAPSIYKRAKPPEPVVEFQDCVTTIQKRDNTSRTEALRRARRENPAAFDAFQEA
jgi:hypothetical protein